ncbi:unnamed protein product [Ectocarpus sp. 6 AP-2014]
MGGCGAILVIGFVLATTRSFSLDAAAVSEGVEGPATSNAMQELHRQARDDVLGILAAPADSCLTSNWRFTSANQGCTAADQCGKDEWCARESRTVTVVGLKAQGEGEESDCNSQNLSILVRLQGPEALAEAATPVEGSRCHEVAGQYPAGSVEMGSVGGVVFYGLAEACCTLCTRWEGCVGWSNTVKPDIATIDGGKKCVLYSSVSGPPVEDKAMNRAITSGVPRDEESMMYLAHSMSIARSWCTPDSARVLGSGKKLTVKAAGPSVSIADGDGALPLCRSTNVLPEPGRWVGLQDVECGDMRAEGIHGDPIWPDYRRDIFGVTKPEECFFKPYDLPTSGGKVDGYQQAISGGYVWKPYDCRYPPLNVEARHTCFEALNITRFLDYGDSMIQTSRQPRAELWLPKNVDVHGKAGSQDEQARGKQAGCPAGFYMDDGNDDAETSGDGSPIKYRYCGLSGFHYSKDDAIRDYILSFRPDVVLANWGMIHKLWHHDFGGEIAHFFENLGKTLDKMTENGEFRPRFLFWLSSPFLVSEREPHCVLERAVQFNDGLRAVLEPRGWIEASARLRVNWTTLTKKWALDIQDGMHHGKHATRMLAHLLVHRMCQDHEDPGP